MVTNFNLLGQISSLSEKPKETSWTNATLRFRDCLIALDDFLMGLSYRDIVTIIYGKECMDEAWNSPKVS